MMREGSYLAFHLAGRRHALPMDCIREILALPFLQPTELAPAHVLGLLNLRGHSVPVLDLAWHLGLPARPAQLEDKLILFQVEEEMWGLAADGIEDLLSFGPGEIEALRPGLEAESPTRTLSALGLKGERLYGLLDPRLLLAEKPSQGSHNRYDTYFGQLPAEVLNVLQQRAQDCQGHREELQGLPMAFATLKLGPELFALPLRSLRQIAPCPEVHPVPGAPEAILGLANHRGDPLLVADLRPLLGMKTQESRKLCTLMILEDGNGALGLAVDEMGDVLTMDIRQLQPHPSRAENPLVQGEWLREDQLITFLILEALLAHPGLRVHNTDAL